MKLVKCLVAASALVGLASAGIAGQSLQVTKELSLDQSAESVWKAIGDFCAIQDWHPAVTKCEVSKDGDTTFRTLTLGDGGKIKEKKTGTSATGYMYNITESPLPVKNYNSLFDVEGNDKSAKVTWTASFEANGKPDSEAKDTIAGIFDAGLKSISEKLAKK